MPSILQSVLLLIATCAHAQMAEEIVAIRFRAVVGDQELACGKSYAGIGSTRSTITPRDFRFYVHNLRWIDEAGSELPLELKQDEKWQLDDLALLDFEDATGACRNGTPDTNRQILAAMPAGARIRGLRFTLGVPMKLNHTDLLAMPSPLNLTALAWVWNTGRTFARLDFSSTGVPRGYTLHLGSTSCTPDDSSSSIPTKCLAPNRPEVELLNFDPGKDSVLADLAALLKDSNVDEAGVCMSSLSTPACGPIFSNFGLPFPGQPLRPQSFFRSSAASIVLKNK